MGSMATPAVSTATYVRIDTPVYRGWNGGYELFTGTEVWVSVGAGGGSGGRRCQGVHAFPMHDERQPETDTSSELKEAIKYYPKRLARWELPTDHWVLKEAAKGVT